MDLTSNAETILTPCGVPWTVIQSMNGVTLRYAEKLPPVCTVVTGAGRVGEDGMVDFRRVELVFKGCPYARVAPHSDNADVESLGYVVEGTRWERGQGGEEYVDSQMQRWRETGICPDPGVYVAKRSAWIDSLTEPWLADPRHYVVFGRDTHVELIAKRATWKEWILPVLAWANGEKAVKGPVVDRGVLEPADLPS